MIQGVKEFDVVPRAPGEIVINFISNYCLHYITLFEWPFLKRTSAMHLFNQVISGCRRRSPLPPLHFDWLLGHRSSRDQKFVDFDGLSGL